MRSSYSRQYSCVNILAANILAVILLQILFAVFRVDTVCMLMYAHAVLKISPTSLPTMRAAPRLLKGLRIPVPKVETPVYTPPALSSVTAADLPNNEFVSNNQYFIKKTAFGHWPVYKKIQNTRISTEVKRVEGNVKLFAEELLKHVNNGNILKRNVKVNTVTGEVNIKGDYTEQVKTILDKHIKYD